MLHVQTLKMTSLKVQVYIGHVDILSYFQMVFFIPGTDAKIFQGAQRVFTFHIEIFSLLSEPTANSVMKRSKCEK